MIVSMKKVTVVAQSKDIDPTLKSLGKAGVVHIEHQNAPESESVAGLEARFSALSKAMDELPDARRTVAAMPPADSKDASADPEEIVGGIQDLVDEKETIEENLKKIRRDIEAWSEWGDFSPELVNDLKSKNIWVRLGKIPKKEQNIPEGVILEEISRKGDVRYCAVISTSEIPLPFKTIPLPERGLSRMIADCKTQEDRIKQIDEKLGGLAQYREALSSYGKRLKSLLEYNRARAGMGRFKRLSYLRGYCPDYNVDSLAKLAEQEKWGLVAEDPDENDNVPTLIKNPRWIEIIKPVFQLIKTIPGYREVDISLWFLLFFSVFFGILIGDAGYGLVFFAINLACHVKFRDKIRDKSVFFLTYVLSLCTIIWGVLTGTFFGQAWLPKTVEPVLPYLRNDANVQELCFFIGALHLSVAHVWRFIRRMPSLTAFAEAGWIFMLWGAYFLAKLLILGQAFPFFGKWLLIAGSVLIILFTSPSRNVFKGIGLGLGDFLLHVVNSFTDVVSYVRLFAVGAATVAVADAFNQMASTIGYGSIFMGFLTALVLLFGHTLNILLGAMAILVHGIRLNVLEFSSHLNMEWSGTEYLPFKGSGVEYSPFKV